MSLTEMTDSPQRRQRWLGEQVLNWSGLPVVHVRATVFLQNPFFLAWAAESIARDGTIRLPFGTGRTSPVDVLDVAEVVATILANPTAHIGKVYELTGPRSQDMIAHATEYSEALGRPVTYVDVPLEQWRDQELAARAYTQAQKFVAHLVVAKGATGLACDRRGGFVRCGISGTAQNGRRSGTRDSADDRAGQPGADRFCPIAPSMAVLIASFRYWIWADGPDGFKQHHTSNNRRRRQTRAGDELLCDVCHGNNADRQPAERSHCRTAGNTANPFDRWGVLPGGRFAFYTKAAGNQRDHAPDIY